MFRVDDLEIDPATREIRAREGVRHVEPQVFDVIVHLIRHRDRIVPKDELIDVVWDGRVVSESALTSRIKSARRALGDDGRAQRVIRNVPGRGYRWVADLIEPELATPQRPRPRHRRARGTSLAILPLDVFGDAAALADLAEGLVENLTTTLASVPFVAVPSRLSASSHKQATADVREIGRSLGVRYVLEGSVQRVGEIIRVNVQLIDAETGDHVWARYFDRTREAAEIPEWVAVIAPILESQLMRCVHQDLADRRDELDAAELILYANTLLSVRGWHRDQFEGAADALRRALDKEPDRALAHADLALLLALGHLVGLLEAGDVIENEVVAEGERALALDGMDSHVMSRVGCALADIGQTERGLTLLEQALELDPRNAHAWTALGTTRCRLQDYETGLEALERGIDMSPRDRRLGLWRTALAQAYLARSDTQRGDLERALAAAEAGCQVDDGLYLPRVLLASARLALSDEPGARRALADCLRVKPDLSTREIDYLIGPEHGRALAALRASD